MHCTLSKRAVSAPRSDHPDLEKVSQGIGGLHQGNHCILWFSIEKVNSLPVYNALANHQPHSLLIICHSSSNTYSSYAVQNSATRPESCLCPWSDQQDLLFSTTYRFSQNILASSSLSRSAVSNGQQNFVWFWPLYWITDWGLWPSSPETVLITRVPSTQAFYAVTWKLFYNWCLPHCLHPAHLPRTWPF